MLLAAAKEAKSTITGRSNKATVDPYIQSASADSISNPNESVKTKNLPTGKGEMKSDRGVMTAERKVAKNKKN